MSVDENEAIVQRHYDELFNRGYAAAHELVSADFVYQGAAQDASGGPAGMLLAAVRPRAIAPPVAT